MVAPFEIQEGVIDVLSGFSGGTIVDPSYESVMTGRTGHLEVVQISFEPEVIPYKALVQTFFQQIDPTDDGGQFGDRGPQYTTAIMVHNEAQRRVAEAEKDAIQQSGIFEAPIVTRVIDAAPFYPAEAYHQCYYKKNPGHYQAYRLGSGRQGFVENSPYKRLI